MGRSCIQHSNAHVASQGSLLRVGRLLYLQGPEQQGHFREEAALGLLLDRVDCAGGACVCEGMGPMLSSWS